MYVHLSVSFLANCYLLFVFHPNKQFIINEYYYLYREVGAFALKITFIYFTDFFFSKYFKAVSSTTSLFSK